MDGGAIAHTFGAQLGELAEGPEAIQSWLHVAVQLTWHVMLRTNHAAAAAAIDAVAIGRRVGGVVRDGVAIAAAVEPDLSELSE
jgi:hypothetical protein